VSLIPETKGGNDNLPSEHPGIVALSYWGGSSVGMRILRLMEHLAPKGLYTNVHVQCGVGKLVVKGDNMEGLELR